MPVTLKRTVSRVHGSPAAFPWHACTEAWNMTCIWELLNPAPVLLPWKEPLECCWLAAWEVQPCETTMKIISPMRSSTRNFSRFSFMSITLPAMHGKKSARGRNGAAAPARIAPWHRRQGDRIRRRLPGNRGHLLRYEGKMQPSEGDVVAPPGMTISFD